MIRRMLTLSLIMAACTAAAQNATRRLPRQARGARPTVAVAADTLRGAICDSIAVAGFDKPLRAVRESMYITNRSTRALDGVRLTIDYLDTAGRQMHRVVRDIAVDLPPAQTRRVEIPAFDRTGALYYRASALPRGVRRATPFDVTVRVDAVICKPVNNQQ
ncbi:MAG: FxLYD domain-containing protein [Bacteroidales bacterium]|nr:FxLYD domain-containing protein [Bacteroidales bacterium]